MPTVHVLPIRFGFSKPSAIHDGHKIYYRKLASVFFFDPVGVDFVISCDQSLPMAAERSLSSESVSELICQAAATSQSPKLIIDVGGPDEKDVSRPNILAGLVLAIDTLLENNPDYEIGVLLPFPVAANDYVAPSLRRVFASNSNVRMLAADGTVSGCYFDEKHIPEINSIANWSFEARMNPYEGLGRKLVRRVGQYQLPGYSQVIRHLYDGRKACDEIYDLLTIWLTERKLSHPISSVAYDVRYSSWFRGPVEAALRDIGLAEISFEIGNNISDVSVVAADILLVPIVRTGKSLHDLMNSSPQIIRNDVAVWALLTTKGQQKLNGEIRVPISDDENGQNVSVKYALKVDGGSRAADSDFWQTCPISPIEPDLEDFSKPLSSDAMWGMILEAGVIEEDTVPKRRPSLGYVPNCGEIATLNGSFLATKVDALLARVFSGGLPPSLAFLCPGEEHAKSLARALRDLAGHDTIFVDRVLIEACRDGTTVSNLDAQSEFSEVSAQLDSWKNLAHRVSIGERPQVILLDEFNSSGETFKGLYNLSILFELPVLCAISLARYPTAIPLDSVRHLALYEMGYSS